MLTALSMAALAAAKGPCGPDIDRLCPGLSNGVPRCLSDHLSKLAPSCRVWVGRYAAAKKQARAQCRRALDRLCPDAVGWSEINKCLQRQDPHKAPAVCVKLYVTLARARAVVTGSGNAPKPPRLVP